MLHRGGKGGPIVCCTGGGPILILKFEVLKTKCDREQTREKTIFLDTSAKNFPKNFKFVA